MKGAGRRDRQRCHATAQRYGHWRYRVDARHRARRRPQRRATDRFHWIPSRASNPPTMSPTDPPNRPTDPSGVKNMTNIRKVRSTTLAVSFVAFGASCTGDDADGARPTVQPTDAAPPETAPPETAPPETAPPETAPPETASPELVEPPATATAAESTTQPSGDTIVVPFHTVDAGFPAGWTCDDAIPGFDVAFTNESDERTIVRRDSPTHRTRCLRGHERGLRNRIVRGGASPVLDSAACRTGGGVVPADRDPIPVRRRCGQRSLRHGFRDGHSGGGSGRALPG